MQVSDQIYEKKSELNTVKLGIKKLDKRLDYLQSKIGRLTKLLTQITQENFDLGEQVAKIASKQLELTLC